MASSVRRFLAEPRWLELTGRRPGPMAGSVWRWLEDSASLTRRVTRACGGEFGVRLLDQGWAKPGASEQALLRLKPGTLCLVREVELLCDDVPQVFARTLIPIASLRGGARRLAGLGSRPLGEVLFADPRTRRVRIQIARFQPRHALYQVATGHLRERPRSIWGRRTLFRYAGKPLLVNELFLPDLVKKTAWNEELSDDFISP